MLRKPLLAVFVISFLSTSIAHASKVVRPDPKVESAAAQVLWDLNLKLRKAKPLNQYTKTGIDPYPFRRVALSLARLGRVQTALQVVGWKPLPDMSYARNEVLRLSARRSALLGNVKQAQSLLSQIDNHYAKADALLALARAYLREQDYSAAQKVLFKVTPQVPNNYQVLLYTAVLFAKSQKIAVSNRLFERAKGMIQTDEEFKKSKSTKPRVQPFIQRAHFGYSLLDAGFIDQWMQYRANNDTESTFPSSREIPLLLKSCNTDALVDVVHHMKPNASNTPFAISVASLMVPRDPKQALALLDKTSADWLKANSQSQESYSFNDPIKFTFAQAYKKLGKKETAEQWMQRIVIPTQQDKRPFALFRFHLLPILVFNPDDSIPQDKSTFPPQQLAAINSAIQPYLPELQNKFKAISSQRYMIQTLMRQLIKMQIAADQKEQARKNINFLDTFLRKSGASGMSNADLFQRALHVAKLWKMVGDQKKSDELLEYALGTSKETSGDIKLFQISTLIRSGFVNVGRRQFRALSPDERKDSRASDIPTELMTQEAIAHPRQFLSEQLSADNSQIDTSDDLYREVNVLYPFVKDITRSLFPSQNEPRHVLNSDGIVYFDY